MHNGLLFILLFIFGLEFELILDGATIPSVVWFL
jgi:hypothetical protein